MARRASVVSRGGIESVESLELAEYMGEPSTNLRVGKGDTRGLQPVYLMKGETTAQAFRRIQRELQGSGRPYVICLE